MAGKSKINTIAGYLPAGRLTNDELAIRWEGWKAEKIYKKTGIAQRAIAGPDEFASDLAEQAARNLLAKADMTADQIDLLICCTQSPDYPLPATACLIQERLGIPTSCAAFDLNQGCSGYIYGLATASAWLEAGLGRRALLLTADTYSKYLDPEDRPTVTLFGDGAAATLLSIDEDSSNDSGDVGDLGSIGPFVFGTDGAGAQDLIVSNGACHGLAGEPARLSMRGPKMFDFTLQMIPKLVQSCLDRGQITQDQVDLFVFHQSNRFMLEALRSKLQIPEDRFVYHLENTGNTVSSSIPLALEQCAADGKLQKGTRLMLVGFGVGYSWGAGLVRWV
jgi:3-oxoacyl-[acyl-carrier-protein] synthase-3